MKITVTSEQELVNVATELAHVLSHLRKYQKKWEQNYGVELKNRKKFWEERADALLQRLQVTEHRNPIQIKIEINEYRKNEHPQ